MPRKSPSRQSVPKPGVRPDSTGFLPPDRKNPFPDIPKDEPGLVGGPATESIPGTAHDDPLDPLGRREKQIVVSLPTTTTAAKRHFPAVRAKPVASGPTITNH